jgi:hypothetical protein
MQGAIAKLDAEDKGYEKGYEAGKQAAVEQIFEDLNKFLEAQEAQCENKRLKDIGDWIFHEYLPNQLAELKKKYEVK